MEESTNTKADNQQNKSYLKNTINWNGLNFNSQAEVKIAEALDRANIIFLSNTKIRLTTATGRGNKIVNFVILHSRKIGIIQISSEPFYPDINLDAEIKLIQNYDISSCTKQPDRVIAEFLELLNQA